MSQPLGRYCRRNPIPVLVRASLPRGIGIAEEDFHPEFFLEALVISKFVAAIIGDGPTLPLDHQVRTTVPFAPTALTAPPAAPVPWERVGLETDPAA